MTKQVPWVKVLVPCLAVAVLDARGDEYVEETEEERALSLSPRPPLLMSPFL